MVQRAIAVFIAVGLHSGDAADKPVAYEVRYWDKSQDCSGAPMTCEALEVLFGDDCDTLVTLETCRKIVSAPFPTYVFDRQINDTHLAHTMYPRTPCSDPMFPEEDAQIVDSCSADSKGWSSGYFWVYSKDVAV